MPRGEAFQLCPTQPSRRHGADFTRIFKLTSSGFDFFPGLGEMSGIRWQTRILEFGEIEVKNGGRRVEREAHHASVRGGVVPLNSRDVGLGIKLEPGFFH